jgi:hypothetical protein
MLIAMKAIQYCRCAAAGDPDPEAGIPLGTAGVGKLRKSRRRSTCA